MKEAQHVQPRVLAIVFECPDRLSSCAIRLAIVGDHHADIMTPARERPPEQSLLDRFAANGVLPVFGDQDR